MGKLHHGYIIIKNPEKHISVIQDLQLFSVLVKNDFSSTPNQSVYIVGYTNKQLEKILYWKKLIQHFVEFHFTENVCNIY